MNNNLPAYFDKLTKIFGFLSICVVISTVLIVYYWFSPEHLNVGYQPDQPIEYSHAIHVDKLGMDCRYCHDTVEKSAYASIPSTETCMNCHKTVKNKSVEVKKIIDSYEKDKPIEWVKVHHLSDYSYFDHSVHINAGVSCVSCHDRVNKMQKVVQRKPMSMSWCIECHQNPTSHLRDNHLVTKLDWVRPDNYKLSDDHIKVNAKTSCSTCHR